MKAIDTLKALLSATMTGPSSEFSDFLCQNLRILSEMKRPELEKFGEEICMILQLAHEKSLEKMIFDLSDLFLGYFTRVRQIDLPPDIQICLSLNNFVTFMIPQNPGYHTIAQLEEELVFFRKKAKILDRKFIFGLLTNALADILMRGRQLSAAMALLEDNIDFFEENYFFELGGDALTCKKVVAVSKIYLAFCHRERKELRRADEVETEVAAFAARELASDTDFLGWIQSKISSKSSLTCATSPSVQNSSVKPDLIYLKDPTLSIRPPSIPPLKTHHSITNSRSPEPSSAQLPIARWKKSPILKDKLRNALVEKLQNLLVNEEKLITEAKMASATKKEKDKLKTSDILFKTSWSKQPNVSRESTRGVSAPGGPNNRKSFLISDSILSITEPTPIIPSQAPNVQTTKIPSPKVQSHKVPLPKVIATSTSTPKVSVSLSQKPKVTIPLSVDPKVPTLHSKNIPALSEESLGLGVLKMLVDNGEIFVIEATIDETKLSRFLQLRLFKGGQRVNGIVVSRDEFRELGNRLQESLAFPEQFRFHRVPHSALMRFGIAHLVGVSESKKIGVFSVPLSLLEDSQLPIFGRNYVLLLIHQFSSFFALLLYPTNPDFLNPKSIPVKIHLKFSKADFKKYFRIISSNEEKVEKSFFIPIFNLFVDPTYFQLVIKSLREILLDFFSSKESLAIISRQPHLILIKDLEGKKVRLIRLVIHTEIQSLTIIVKSSKSEEISFKKTFEYIDSIYELSDTSQISNKVLEALLLRTIKLRKDEKSNISDLKVPAIIQANFSRFQVISIKIFYFSCIAYKIPITVELIDLRRAIYIFRISFCDPETMNLTRVFFCNPDYLNIINSGGKDLSESKDIIKKFEEFNWFDFLDPRLELHPHLKFNATVGFFNLFTE